MKKIAIFLIVIFSIFSFIPGCRNSEVEELKEQAAELSEKLAEEEVEDNQAENVEGIVSIPWIEAKNHLGEEKAVYGPVVATYYDDTTEDRTTFINIGKDYPDPDGFSIWIDGINRTNFSDHNLIFVFLIN